MVVYLGAGLFCAGASAAFWILFRFERQLRRERSLNRERVRAAIMGLLVFGLISGCGMAILGMSAFFGARSGQPGAGAYLWALLFAAVATLGWPAVLIAAFMARVNALK